MRYWVSEILNDALSFTEQSFRIFEKDMYLQTTFMWTFHLQERDFKELALPHTMLPLFNRLSIRFPSKLP
jgi:hypothetical protein